MHPIIMNKTSHRRKKIFFPVKYIYQRILISGLLFCFVSINGAAENLALKDAAQTALENNPRILSFLSQYRSLMAANRLTLGLYDWGLSLEGGYGQQDQPVVSVFQPTERE